MPEHDHMDFDRGRISKGRPKSTSRPRDPCKLPPCPDVPRRFGPYGGCLRAVNAHAPLRSSVALMSRPRRAHVQKQFPITSRATSASRPPLYFAEPHEAARAGPDLSQREYLNHTVAQQINHCLGHFALDPADVHAIIISRAGGGLDIHGVATATRRPVLAQVQVLHGRGDIRPA